MDPSNITLGVGIVLLFIGVAAAVVILEVIGKPDANASRSKRLISTHKILAYVFIAIFILTAVGMLLRLRFWPGEVESRVSIHWVLADAVFAFIIAKIILNRRYRKLNNHLPVLGWSILLCTFILFSLTGGYNLIRHSGGKGTRTRLDYAQSLVNARCSGCHTLERVYTLTGSDEQIRSTVKRMQGLSLGWVTEDEADLIAEFLIYRAGMVE